METAVQETMPGIFSSEHGFRLLSFLLDYPDHEGFDLAALQLEVKQITHPKIAGLLQKFISYLEAHPIEDVAAIYVRTFDFDSETSIYLTQGVQTEEREGTLEDLRQTYEEIGLLLKTEELPDFLPLVLEFVTLAPYQIASGLLLYFYPVIQEISHVLNDAENPYGWVTEACLIQIEQYLQVVEQKR